ncbi:MAG: MerR family transcriptional regulator [Heyndrickxia sp.]
MDQNVYHIKEFAEKAAISVRTLRYYDKKGLLVPSLMDQSGYKLYTDNDFTQLQSILTFKFLGFSLSEIGEILSGNPEELHRRLEQQKVMMMGKRSQIDQIIEAIEKVEKTIQSDTVDINSVVNLIQVTQMNLKPEWVEQYLSKDERLTMREIAKESYSKDALQKLAARGWNEEDHQQHLNKYQFFRKSLTKLVREGVSPGSKEAQELVRFLQDMNKRFSQDDPSIREGMKKSWEKFNSLPKNKQPKTYAIPEQERDFIKSASEIFYTSKS